MLDYEGAEFLVERRGDDDKSARVELEAGWWISTAEIRYPWDARVQLWDSGRELLRVENNERERDLWRLADLILAEWICAGGVIPLAAAWTNRTR